MKAIYESANMEIYPFANEDIIATSNDTLKDFLKSSDSFNGGALH